MRDLERLPTVQNTIRGRFPGYLKPLYILSSMTFQTEDKTTSYRIATINNVSTATDSTFLVLDTNNSYRGFADSELRACELAELIIQKPILQSAHTYR